jgi:3-oxoacyl-[acyl-carrier protein] reductase
MNILLTGASSGIGKELVKNFKEEKFNLIVCGRSKFNLHKLRKIKQNIRYFKCDVSKEKEVIKFKKYVLRYYKKIDVIINCAGVYGEIGRLDKINFKFWKKTIEINFFGTVLICKYFIDLLLKSTVKKIINFSGGGAFNAFPNFSAYACSKAAVVRFTENLAQEFKKEKVIANCIAPGFNMTAMQNDVLEAGSIKAGKNFYNFVKKKNKIAKNSSILVPIKCINFLIKNKIKKISGRVISANFDDWNNRNFKNVINDKKNSELFYMRRINIKNIKI